MRRYAPTSQTLIAGMIHCVGSAIVIGVPSVLWRQRIDGADTLLATVHLSLAVSVIVWFVAELRGQDTQTIRKLLLVFLVLWILVGLLVPALFPAREPHRDRVLSSRTAQTFHDRRKGADEKGTF